MQKGQGIEKRDRHRERQRERERDIERDIERDRERQTERGHGLCCFALCVVQNQALQDFQLCGPGSHSPSLICKIKWADFICAQPPPGMAPMLPHEPRRAAAHQKQPVSRFRKNICSDESNWKNLEIGRASCRASV